MAHTLESVLKQLGDEAQLVGGRVIIYRDSKHIDIGGLGLQDGAFNLTEEGSALLDADASQEAPAKTKNNSKKTAPDTNADSNENADGTDAAGA